MSATHVVFSYDPTPAQAKVARWRGVLRQRAISLVLSLAIGVALWYFFAASWGDAGPWLIALPAVTGSLWLLVALGGWLVARSDLKRLGQGPALAVSAAGVWAAQESLDWTQVGGLRAASRSLGRSADLILDGRDGRSIRLPLDYLDALPATLDSAIRALSGGRCWIDFSRLDDV